jgi:hypothetical protein
LDATRGGESGRGEAINKNKKKGRGGEGHHPFDPARGKSKNLKDIKDVSPTNFIKRFEHAKLDDHARRLRCFERMDQLMESNNYV